MGSVRRIERKGDIIMVSAKQGPEAGIITVFIAESVPVFRHGLEACLAGTPGLKVAGQVEEGAALKTHLDRAQADVMLLDSALPGLEGFALLKEVKDACPSLPVLLMAATADIGWLLRGIRAGAAGVVFKDAPAADFLTAIRRVATGHPYIAEPLAEKLVLYYQRNEKEPLDERLSPREFQVMQFLARGLKLSEIARMLGLSHQTITTHRRHILEKTGLRTTAEIIRYGILNGLTEFASQGLSARPVKED